MIAGRNTQNSNHREFTGTVLPTSMGPTPTFDGSLATPPEAFLTITTQRCWVHKTTNVLDKMPKSVQGRAKKMIHDSYMASTKENAETAFDHFIAVYEDKYPKATGRLGTDREALMRFYNFPVKHWKHIRSTNVIESVCATVRLRTKKTRACGIARGDTEDDPQVARGGVKRPDRKVQRW